MIKKFDLSRVRLMEFFQVMTNIKVFLEKENLKTLGLEKAKKVFDEKYTAFDEALKPLKKSDLTAKIHELDSQRDEALVGLSAHARAFTNFPDPAKSSVAKKILAHIEKYGKNLQNKPLQEETGIIINLLQDLSVSEMTQALTTIGATEWITKMQTANEALAQMHNDRTEANGAVEVGKSKQTRQELQEAFKQIVKTINALSFVNGEEPYRNIANAINEEMKNARK